MSSSEVIKDQPIEESVSVNKDFHIVKSGDNLYRISEKYQVFVEDILEWNGITSPDGISLGDKIYLTKEAASKAGRIVAAAPKKEVEKPLTVSKSKIHTVLKGETAYKICTQYKIKTQDLVEWNGLKDAGSIKEGQTLKVSQ